jgi:hypothetical protein
VSRYDDLSFITGGEWHLSTVEATNKGGPIFLTYPRNEKVLLSDLLERFVLQPVKGVTAPQTGQKCHYIYLCWEPDLPEPVETSAAPAVSPIPFVIDDDDGLEVLDDPLDLPEVSEIIESHSKGKRPRSLSLQEQQQGMETRGRARKAQKVSENADE